MKFRHLEYFVAAAEELNLTRAADRLHVSQPPFSKQIHDLENSKHLSFRERHLFSTALLLLMLLNRLMALSKLCTMVRSLNSVP
jgi:DNA-binding transcriptional LysR family regulator